MKIKKGDKVKILSGKDRGKAGKILQVFTEKKKISVEGLNLLIKHLRPRREGEKGQRIEFPAALDSSNVALICPKCDKVTRVGHKMLGKTSVEGVKVKNRKVRVCKKCKQVID